jgi:DNA-directed RNA polymerase specialized sigma24 family protein
MIMRNLWIDKYRSEHLLEVESLDAMSNADSLSTVEPQVHDMLENEELLNTLRINQGPLTLREQQLLIRHLQGYSCSEIAEEMSEDVRLTRCDLNAVKAKVRYRLMKRKGNSTAHGRYNAVHRQTGMALKGGQQPFHSELISALVN